MHLLNLIFLQDSVGKSHHYQVSNSYGARYGTNPIPKFKISSKVRRIKHCRSFTKYISHFQGVSADSAYRIIHDELALGEYYVLVVVTHIANVFKTDLLCSI